MPTLTLLNGDGRRKDYALRPSASEPHYFAVVSGAGTYYLDLTQNASIADTSTVFVHTGTGGHFYPKTIYDLIFAEQLFRGYNSYKQVYTFTLYFEQAGSKFEVFFKLYSASMDSGAPGYRCRIYCSFKVLRGPQPRSVTITFRAVGDSGNQTAYQVFNMPYPDSQPWERSTIGDIYLYPDLYCGLTARMS